MDRIDQAERHRKGRALIFLGGAVVMLASSGIAIGLHQTGRPFWLIMVVGFAMWLTPVTGWIGRNRAIAPLLEDELTQQHRKDSFTAGFWAATGSAAMLSALGPVLALSPGEVARIVVTAGLAAALASFAILEIRSDT